jgi:hypothetical protein
MQRIGPGFLLFLFLLLFALLSSTPAAAQLCQKTEQSSTRCPFCLEYVETPICYNWALGGACCDYLGETWPCSPGCGDVFVPTVNLGCTQHHPSIETRLEDPFHILYADRIYVATCNGDLVSLRDMLDAQRAT